MASYPIPPWLHPFGDPGELLLQSQRQGAAIAQEKQRLAQQHEQAVMENETKQEIAAQRAREDQQQLEVDKARYTAEAGLKSRQLDIAQSKVQQGAVAAAHRFAAQQQMGQRIAAGEDPAKVALSTPELGLPGSGIAALARSTTPKPNISVEPVQRSMKMPDGSEVPYLLNPKTGATHFPKASIPEGLSQSAQARLRIQNLNSQKKEFAKELADPITARYSNMTDAEIKSLDKKLAPSRIARKQAALALHNKVDAIDKQIEDILNGKKSPTPKAGRIKVKSPQGKVGTIPAEQLDEAIKSGYTEVGDDH